MTKAEQVAAQFGNDGQVWVNEKDQSLHHVATDVFGGSVGYRDGYGTGLYRVTFSDDSSLVVADECWDLGTADFHPCYCMDGAGHSEGCLDEQGLN